MGRISDRRISVIAHLRSEAVCKLNLKPGDRVIDSGYGNGGSFPYLLERAGLIGEVVGIEDQFRDGQPHDLQKVDASFDCHRHTTLAVAGGPPSADAH